MTVVSASIQATRSAFHQDAAGRPQLDLREAAEQHALDLADLPELTEAERALAMRTWRGRMVNEHLSAQVWATLVVQGMRAAMPAEILAGLAQAAADELRHAEQCAAVVVALGGEAVAPLPPLEPVPEHADAGPLEAFLRNITSVGCMSETVAVSVIRAEQAELEGTLLGRVLDQILADEVAHARLGWKVLGISVPLLDEAARRRLGAYLVDALSHQVEFEVPKLPLLGALREEVGLAGVCDGGFARSVFRDTIEEVIVPGLERAGLPGRAAWERARRQTAHVWAS